MATITSDDKSWYQRCRKLLSSVWIFISGSIIASASSFLLHVCKKTSNMELPVASTTARRSQLMGDDACPLSAGFPCTSRTGRNSLDSHLQRNNDKNANTVRAVNDVPDNSPVDESDSDSSVLSAPYITSSTSCDNTTVTASISWESRSVYSSPPPSVVLHTPIITITSADTNDEQADTASPHYDDALNEVASEFIKEEDPVSDPSPDLGEPSCQPKLGSLAQRRGFHGDPIITPYTKPQVLLSPSISCWSPHSRRSSGSIPHTNPRTVLLSPDAVYNARIFSELPSLTSADCTACNRLLNTPATVEPTPLVTFHEALIDVTAGLSLTDFDMDEFTSFIDNLSIGRKGPSLAPLTQSPESPTTNTQGADFMEFYQFPEKPDRYLPQSFQNFFQDGHNDTMDYQPIKTSEADAKACEDTHERLLLFPPNSDSSVSRAKTSFETGCGNSDLAIIGSSRSAYSSTPCGPLQHFSLNESLSPVDMIPNAGKLGSGDVRAVFPLLSDVSGSRKVLTGISGRIVLKQDKDQKGCDDNAEAAKANEARKVERAKSLTSLIIWSSRVLPLLERGLENTTKMSSVERHDAIKSWISLVNTCVGTNITPGPGTKQRSLAFHSGARLNSDSPPSLTKAPLAAKNVSEWDCLARSASLAHFNQLPSARTRFSLVRRQSSLDNICSHARAVAGERQHASVINTSRKRFLDSPLTPGSNLRPLMLPIRLAMREFNVVDGTTSANDTTPAVASAAPSRLSAAVHPQRLSAMSGALSTNMVTLNDSECPASGISSFECRPRS